MISGCVINEGKECDASDFTTSPDSIANIGDYVVECAGEAGKAAAEQYGTTCLCFDSACALDSDSSTSVVLFSSCEA